MKFFAVFIILMLAVGCIQALPIDGKGVDIQERNSGNCNDRVCAKDCRAGGNRSGGFCTFGMCFCHPSRVYSNCSDSECDIMCTDRGAKNGGHCGYSGWCKCRYV